MRKVSLASGVLKTRSLSVSRAGKFAVSWLACNHPRKGCYPDDSGTPDAALRLAELSARGRAQPAITLTGHVGDSNDVLAYSPRGDLLAVYATAEHIFARVSPPNGVLSAPALVSPYPGRAAIGAGIDARGAIITAWAEQPCGTECGRVTCEQPGVRPTAPASARPRPSMPAATTPTRSTTPPVATCRPACLTTGTPP